MRKTGAESARNKKPEWPKVEVAGNVSVKIYRRLRADKSYGYEVADYSTGKRRLLSFADLDKARAKANKIANLIAAGETTAAQLRNADAASYGRAVEFIRPTGVPLEVAASHFAEAFRILGGDKIVMAAEFFVRHNPDRITPKTVPDVVSEMVSLRKAELEKGEIEQNTYDDLKNRCEKFQESFSVPVSSVTTADLQTWLDKLPVAKRTKKNYLAKISQLFSYAERRGYIIKNSNPASGVELGRLKRGQVQIWTPEELGRLLKAASPEFLPCIAIGAFAGLRASEIQRLEWEHINWKEGHILAAAKKVGTPSRRFVPLRSNLQEWLKPYAGKKGLVWKPEVLDRKRAEDYFSDAQKEALAKTGDPEKNIEPLKEWKHNGLRHSYASYRLAETSDENKTALEMGDRPKTVHEFYRDLTTEAAAKTYFALAPEAATNVIPLKAAN